jgi:hypothetical protein
MDTITIPAGGGTPEMVLDFANATFSFKGESYPEDVNAFYGKIVDTITGFVTSLSGGNVKMHMHLVYFNSSSTKVFHNLFQMLEAAMDSNAITAEVDWLYHEEDDMSLEFVEGFKDDFERIKFNLITVE